MLSCKAKKYMNSQLIFYIVFLLIGVSFFISGTFFHVLEEEMIGICLGFIPTGILGIILTLRMKKNPKNTEKIVNVKTDERLQLIRYKSGHLSFWITFIGVGILAVTSRYINISLHMLLALVMVFMAAMHITISIIYNNIS